MQRRWCHLLAACPIASLGPPATGSSVSLILLSCLRGIGGRSRRRGAALLLSGGLRLLGLPFHGAAGVYGFAGLWFALLLGGLPLPADELVEAPASHLRIAHLQGSAAGVDLVVMGKIGEAFEHAEQLLIPRSSPDLHIAGATLRTERSEPGELVATFRGRRCGEATERAHQVKRLGLARLSRVLAEADVDPAAVLRGGIEQQSFDVARVGPPTHHIQKPVTSVLVAAELDADRPIGVVELVLFGGGEIPVADHVEVGRSLVDDGPPLPLEITPGSRSDLPIAAQQPLALEQR